MSTSIEKPGKWHRSSFCETGNCLEVTRVGDTIMLRDSKDPEGPFLTVSVAEWKAFLAGVNAREFDVD